MGPGAGARRGLDVVLVDHGWTTLLRHELLFHCQDALSHCVSEMWTRCAIVVKTMCHNRVVSTVGTLGM